MQVERNRIKESTHTAWGEIEQLMLEEAIPVVPHDVSAVEDKSGSQPETYRVSIFVVQGKKPQAME
ncbi:hypothetical protein MUK42_03820 [Musa troglodytarum]|uniref:Uncharacterized protein n=1 Tax=Musa troglodytarum TaxID=320322 RepID=A0A9E7K539_9LILI|nr:hypothetical protein MUK42_03820 [Musa troglodytarum]